MCGIAGYIYLDGRPLAATVDAGILEAMGRAMEHRGPDDNRTMLWQNAGFIFKRLSIVDLDAGQQPFEVDDGHICAMANGEIYNHRDIRRSLLPRYTLSTGSDCEVLPYLYLERGLNLFDDVNGMFAVAILDRRQKRLLLARDRVGIKPLFYCVTPDRQALVFASELKALFAHPGVPREFDWHASMSLALTQDTRGRELPSFFRGIERLPAGHILDLSLESGQFVVQPYWHQPQRASLCASQAPPDFVARYRELLEDSVRLRLMTDVDLGVFLSGGVDSAAVAALAARHMDVPTFSVSSASTSGSGDVAASVNVARHTGQVNHQVYFDQGDAPITPDMWRQVLWACEFPMANAEQLYKYFLHAFARSRYPNLKVMLLGQGVDEFAGGYMEWTLKKRLVWEPSHWQAMSEEMRALETRRASVEAGYEQEYGGLIANGVLDPDFVCAAAGRPQERSTLDMYQGYYRQNLDFHLWHEDRTASAHSIESRVPFLDHRLLELIALVPEEHHPQLFSDKRILRDAVADLLPAEIANRPKGYFFYGKEQHRTFAMMYSILVADNRSLIDQAIAGSQASAGPLQPGAFHDYVTEVGRDDNYTDIHRLLKLVNMGVLADMAGGVTTSAKAANGPLPVRELGADEIREMEVEVGSAMPRNTSHVDQLAPRLVDGIDLSYSRSGTVTLSVPGEEVLTVDSPGWATFLRAIDGEKTTLEIITRHNLPRHRMIRLLRSAVADGLITLHSR